MHSQQMFNECIARHESEMLASATFKNERPSEDDNHLRGYVLSSLCIVLESSHLPAANSK